jgi:integrase
MVERDVQKVGQMVCDSLEEQGLISYAIITDPDDPWTPDYHEIINPDTDIDPPALLDDPIEDAIEEYLDLRRTEHDDNVIGTFRTKLGWFVRYCQQMGVRSVGDLTPDIISKYHAKRRDELHKSDKEQLHTKTLQDDMYLLRNFIRHLEQINKVDEGLSQAVHIPESPPQPSANDACVAGERAEEILDYLDQYRYASAKHILIFLLRYTGARRSDVRAVDLDDLYLDEEVPYVEFKHRPNAAESTKLKNGYSSERRVALPQSAAPLLRAYINDRRISATEEDGRRPLLTTENGRVSKSTIKSWTYQWTRPCVIGKPCPHNREEASCEAKQNNTKAFKCPSSEATHAFRTGNITDLSGTDLSVEMLGDRTDVSRDVLKDHYDMRTEEEKFEQRKEKFESLWDDEDE